MRDNETLLLGEFLFLEISVDFVPRNVRLYFENFLLKLKRLLNFVGSNIKYMYI